MVSTNDYAVISANVYDGSYIPPGYALVGQVATANGFAAFAFQQITTS